MQPLPVETIRRIVAHHFPAWKSPTISLVHRGGSTLVYQIRTDVSVFYFRILPEAGSNFLPEARVHEILRANGVRVPEVVHVESDNSEINRSWMVTTEIAGSPIGPGDSSDNIRKILTEAGADLASINRIRVEGFGWVRRDRTVEKALRGEFSTYSEWINNHYGECPSVLAAAGVLSKSDADALDDLIAREADSASSDQAYLAHGDFDLTHIYVDRGKYSGIIDFGEIRGTSALYDLGHFQIENHELLPDLLEGYATRVRLPGGYRRQIDLFTLIIALERLSRHLKTGRALLPRDLVAVRRARLALG